jgi:hypothetical protein
MAINADNDHDGGQATAVSQPGHDLTWAGEAPPAGPDGPGVPAAPRPQRRRIALISAIAVALVLLAVAVGVGIQHFAVPRGSSPGRLVLPNALLGLSQGTGPGARSLDSRLRQGDQAANRGVLVHGVAAVYGNPRNRWLAVAGGGLCDSCAPNSARVLVKEMVAKGWADARPFPAGPGAVRWRAVPRPPPPARQSAAPGPAPEPWAGCSTSAGSHPASLTPPR